MKAVSTQSTPSFTRGLYTYQCGFYEKASKNQTLGSVVATNLVGRVLTLAISLILHAEAVYRAVAVCFLTIKESFSKSNLELLQQQKQECSVAYSESMKSLIALFYRQILIPHMKASLQQSSTGEAPFINQEMEIPINPHLGNGGLEEPEFIEVYSERSADHLSLGFDSAAALSSTGSFSIPLLADPLNRGPSPRHLESAALILSAPNSRRSSVEKSEREEAPELIETLSVHSLAQGSGKGWEVATASESGSFSDFEKFNLQIENREEKTEQSAELKAEPSPAIPPQSPLSFSLHDFQEDKSAQSPIEKGAFSPAIHPQSPESFSFVDGAASPKSPGAKSSPGFEIVKSGGLEIALSAPPRSPGMSSLSSAFEDLELEAVPPMARALVFSPLQIDRQNGASPQKPSSPYLKLFDEEQPGLIKAEAAGAPAQKIATAKEKEKERLQKEILKAQQEVCDPQTIAANLHNSFIDASAQVGMGEKIIRHFRAPATNFRDKSWKIAASGAQGTHSAAICQFAPLNNPLIAEQIAMSLSIKVKGSEHAAPLFGVFDPHIGPRAAQFLVTHLPNFLTQHLNYFSQEGLSQQGIWNALSLAFLNLNSEFIRIHKETKDSERVVADHGASATVALILNGSIWVAQLGSSRAALNNGGEAIQLTEHPDPKNPKYAELVSRLGGHIDQRGLVNGHLNMSTGFGHAYLEGAISAKPVITKYNLNEVKPGSHLILGTSSLFQATSSRQLANWLHQKKNCSATDLVHDVVYSVFTANQSSIDPKVKNSPISALVVGINARPDHLI